MQTVAQNWLVLEMTNSPVAAGARFLPRPNPDFSFLPYRRRRRRPGGPPETAGGFPTGADVVRISTCDPVCALNVHVWHILSLSFVVGLAQAFGGPAYQALGPDLVAPKMANAIALNSIQFNLAASSAPCSAASR